MFCFNYTYLKQEKGTAMGTKFAPGYAILTIGYLEKKLYDFMENNYETEFYIYFKLYWKRFLNDCFIPWTTSREELRNFHDILNNLHSDIKFTLQFDTVEQSFLDFMVRNKKGNIETDIYYNETDSK